VPCVDQSAHRGDTFAGGIVCGKQIDTKIASTEALEYGGSPDGIEVSIEHQFATECVGCAFRLPHDPAASTQRASDAVFYIAATHDRRMTENIMRHLMGDDKREFVIIAQSRQKTSR